MFEDAIRHDLDTPRQTFFSFPEARQYGLLAGGVCSRAVRKAGTSTFHSTLQNGLFCTRQRGTAESPSAAHIGGDARMPDRTSGHVR